MEEEEPMEGVSSPVITKSTTSSAATGKFSLANFNVLQSPGTSFTIGQSVGSNGNGEDNGDKRKKGSRNKNRRRKISMKSRVLQEAIITLYPDEDDPGEAMRRAKESIKQEAGVFAGSNSVAPGREKIGPGNDYDDLPIFVKTLTDFVIRQELEEARFLTAHRLGDEKTLKLITEKRNQEKSRRIASSVGSAHRPFASIRQFAPHTHIISFGQANKE